jgi:hypothetical protein
MPERHQVKLTFGAPWGHPELICPGEGCQPDPEAASKECWLKGWADNEDLTEYLEGEVTVQVDAEWDAEHEFPLVKIVDPAASVVTPEMVETFGRRIYEELCNRELLVNSDEGRNVLDVVRVALAQESSGGAP